MIPLKIKIIIGSTRQGRFSEKPAQFIADEAKRIPNASVEILDLRDYPMPFYDNAQTPSHLGGKYPHIVTQKWAAKIEEGDAFIIVTPEYNHGYPAVLKNALDAIYAEWGKKPVGFIGYGSVSGARAIEQLRQVVIELQMVPIKASIHLPGEVYAAVMKEQVPVNPELFNPLRKTWAGDRIQMFLDELTWMAKALKTAREQES